MSSNYKTKYNTHPEQYEYLVKWQGYVSAENTCNYPATFPIAYFNCQINQQSSGFEKTLDQNETIWMQSDRHRYYSALIQHSDQLYKRKTYQFNLNVIMCTMSIQFILSYGDALGKARVVRARGKHYDIVTKKYIQALQSDKTQTYYTIQIFLPKSLRQ